MKRNLLYVLGVVCLMTSCVEENFENHGVSPMAGKEVVFSADMNDGPVTRTNYGDPVTNTSGTTTAFKVNWADNDSVLVYCLDSKTSGKYEVVPAVDENGEYLNYAEDLVKDGEHGVQWSDEETSTFVAVYPAKNSSVSENGVITTNISSVQNNVFEPIYGTDGTTVTGWKGKAFDNDANSPTMTNGIMFARTVASPQVTDKNGNQTTTNTVNLRFKPYSTVLKFEFVGYEPNIETIQTVYVQSITLTAPQPIAGEFNLSVTENGDDAVVDGCNTNSTTKTITLNTMLPGGSFIPLKKNQTLEFNVFTIPSGNHTLSGEWKVTLKTDNGDYTYSLIPTTGTNTLAAGQINKIKVPKLEIKTSKTLDPTKWISELPKPVYLSELSVPGAWYCMDDGYQTSTIGLKSDKLTYSSQMSTAADGTITSYYTTSETPNGVDDGLENLYYNGVRAFNIDCRISKSEDTNDGWFPGTENTWTDSNYSDGNSYLACSGTEKWDGFSSTQYVNDGVYVSDALKSLVELAKAHPEEYIVVVMTFAEKPKENSSGIYGTINPVYITEQLNIILSTSGIVEYLYTGITPNTTIEDVISSGKNVIVKINHSNVNFATSTAPSFAMPDGIMASFGSMAMSGFIQNNVTDIFSEETYANYYKKMQIYPIYNGKTANNMTYYFHQAQKTESSTTTSGATYPSIYDRIEAVKDVLNEATTIYNKSLHNALFQIGIGGSVNDSPSTLAETINPEVQKLIKEKLENDPSPVGFVLMNEALNTDYGLPLVKDVINMNTKFYLKRKGGDIITGNEGDNDGGIDEGEGEEL